MIVISSIVKRMTEHRTNFVEAPKIAPQQIDMLNTTKD